MSAEGGADGSARVDIPWGGQQDRTFRLGLGQVRELQRVTGCGPRRLIDRIVEGSYFADDVYHVLKLGLIGAGVPALEAAVLVKTHAEEKPLKDSEYPALRVLFGFYEPAAGDELGKREAEKALKKSTLTGGSHSPPSTGSAAS